MPKIGVVELETLTVAVRASDGACFPWRKGLQSAPLRKILRLSSLNGIENKWRYMIQQLLKHKRPCRVRLLIGFQDAYGQVPIVEEVIYRPINARTKPTTRE